MAKSSELPGSVDYHFDNGDFVTLVVGPEKHELLSHANFIARESVFFKTALKKEWREGQTRTIYLPDDEHETVTHYLRFLYGKTLPTADFDDEVDLHPEVDALFVTLVKLYLFANRVMRVKLKHELITEMHRICCDCHYKSGGSCYPNYRSINILWEGTSEDDPARDVVIDFYIFKGGKDRLSSMHDPDFLLALSQELLEGLKDKNESERAEFTRWDLYDIDTYLIGYAPGPVLLLCFTSQVKFLLTSPLQG